MGGMCGRFAVTTDPALLAEKIKAIDETNAAKDASAPNYNVAPTTTVATVVKRHTDPDDESTRRVRLMRWGLIPPWTKATADGGPDNKGPLLINARSEKVSTSPAFRSSAKNKRCLVPMDGWYEWKGEKGSKTPFSCTPGMGSRCSWPACGRPGAQRRPKDSTRCSAAPSSPPTPPGRWPTSTTGCR